jgi:hypothetical protein
VWNPIKRKLCCIKDKKENKLEKLEAANGLLKEKSIKKKPSIFVIDEENKEDEGDDEHEND